MIILRLFLGRVETWLMVLVRCLDVKAALGALVSQNQIHVFQALVEAGWDVNEEGGHLGTALA